MNSRRGFLRTLAGLPAALSLWAGPPAKEIPRRVLGRTGLSCTMLGFGAAWLGLYQTDEPAIELGRRALDLGINFFDTARDYGVSEERLGKVLEGKRKNIVLMTKVLGRSREEAEQQLATSLRMLRTDYLDVWQIHSVKLQPDLDAVFGPNGAMEAALAAQKAGKVRFIGVSGHKNPDVILKALESYNFDTVQMPLNLVDPFYRSFEKAVLPELVKRKTGVLAMKSMAGGWMLQKGVARAKEALPYVWSLPVHVLISGAQTIEQLDENAKLAQEFKPMSEKEKTALLERVKPLAGNQTEYYKMKPDGSL
ncbi:MAG TPA: aldo/keto reductase [Candidatus Acidoferrales bacterium]|nr:aldo/keto reductase [Candidatus Acidoferrales bacterium]